MRQRESHRDPHLGAGGDGSAGEGGAGARERRRAGGCLRLRGNASLWAENGFSCSPRSALPRDIAVATSASTDQVLGHSGGRGGTHHSLGRAAGRLGDRGAGNDVGGGERVHFAEVMRASATGELLLRQKQWVQVGRWHRSPSHSAPAGGSGAALGKLSGCAERSGK